MRGEFLRALILSNNQEIEVDSKKYFLKIDPRGIMFSGLYVSGEFNFSFCSTDLLFLFGNSIFEKEINISDSKIKFLNFQGTKILSIDAQRLVCESQVFLRDGFESNGKINFHSAQIGGDLDCSNGKFYNENGYALNCEKSKIDGSICFNNKNKITINCDKALIHGSLYLFSVDIKGNINFDSLNIDNTLNIIKLNIIGNLILNSSIIK